jgi:hypothetical protein
MHAHGDLSGCQTHNDGRMAVARLEHRGWAESGGLPPAKVARTSAVVGARALEALARSGPAGRPPAAARAGGRGPRGRAASSAMAHDHKGDVDDIGDDDDDDDGDGEAGDDDDDEDDV